MPDIRLGQAPANLTRRQWLAGFMAAVAVPQFKAPAASRSGDSVTPEQFGARGDGLTNDTAAFAAMTAFINRRSGGEIVLRSTTYIVGQQGSPKKSDYAFAPMSIMDFAGCSGR